MAKLSLFSKKNKTVVAETIITDKTHFTILEAYKIARTNLMFTFAGETGCKKVLVTSSDISEGKSTSTINLAITFAQTGARVLVMEADLRRPKIHQYLSMPNDAGMAECLGGFKELDEVIQHVDAYGMDCITGGSIPPNPSELLVSPAMKDVMDKLSERYDYIFVDSPPINVVADSASIASLMTGTLIVVKQNHTTDDALGHAIANLEFSQVKILGYLLTHAVATSKKHYRYRYGKRYGGYGAYIYKA